MAFPRKDQQMADVPQLFWFLDWNMNFIFHNIWDVILPIDELIFFKMVIIAPPTRILLYNRLLPLLNPFSSSKKIFS